MAYIPISQREQQASKIGGYIPVSQRDTEVSKLFTPVAELPMTFPKTIQTPVKVGIFDVLKEIPSATKQVGVEIGQSIARSFLATETAIKNVVSGKNVLDPYIPITEREKKIYGDKPVSFETIGREVAGIIGAEEKIPKELAIPLGIVFAGLDIFPPTTGRSSLKKSAQEIAKLNKMDEIFPILKKVIKGGDDEIKSLAKGLEQVSDPLKVEEILTGIKKTPAQLSISKEFVKAQRPTNPNEKILQEVIKKSNLRYPTKKYNDVKSGQYLYHGTSEGAFRRIRENGMTTGQAIGSEGKSYGDLLFFTDSQVEAASYATRKGAAYEPRILRIKVDNPNDFYPDMNVVAPGDFVTAKSISPADIEVKIGNKWMPIQEHINENYNLMPVRNKAQTKSQLISIWNEANKTKKLSLPPKTTKVIAENYQKQIANISRLEEQKFNLEEMLYETQLKDLEKYEVKGELPEVVGKIEGKRQNEFAIRGDDMATELGYADSEDLRTAYQDYKRTQSQYRDIKKRLAEARSQAGEKVITGKQLLAERAKTEYLREKLTFARTRRVQTSAIRDFFGLTDAEIKKIDARDIRLMGEKEYSEFLDKFYQKASQLAETRQRKNELITLINDREFQKWDNLRKSLKLPSVDKMNESQLAKMIETLEPYQKGDVFLGQRKLETIENTDLKGIKTMREAKAKLAKEIGVKPEDLDKIKVGWFDRFRWDTALAESNPFYKLLVEDTAKSFIDENRIYLEWEKELNELAKKALKSRKRGIIERLVPQQKQLRMFLEATPKDKMALLNELTDEEVQLANFIQSSYEQALDYLLKTETIKGTRFNNQDYFTHIRRGTLEAVKEDGIIKAFKELFSQYKEDAQVFNILDSETGNILPLEKFFKFSLFRTGQLKPTENVIEATRIYFKTLGRKKALDSILPKFDIYAYALTPEKMSKQGLTLDRSMQKFVKEWLNNKKGRRIDFLKIPQGSAPDLAIRAVRTFTSLLDLGLNIGVGAATYIGEKIATYTILGKRKYALVVARRFTSQGKKILKEAESFIGKSPWAELVEPAKGAGENLMKSLFIQFDDAARRANKTFLLGSLTDEEWKTGKISSERLAQLRTQLGRYRVVQGAKSIIGSTSAGGAATQYKTWAIPIFRTIMQDFGALGKTIITRKKQITGQQIGELYRLLEIGAIGLITGSYVMSEKKDDTLIGQLKTRAYKEAMTLYGALDPKTIISTPRIVKFIEDLANNLSLIIKLEEYKEKPGLKGVEGLKRQLTPRTIKQFQSDETKKSEQGRSMETILREANLPPIPSLETPKLPSLPKIKY